MHPQSTENFYEIVLFPIVHVQKGVLGVSTGIVALFTGFSCGVRKPLHQQLLRQPQASQPSVALRHKYWPLRLPRSLACFRWFRPSIAGVVCVFGNEISFVNASRLPLFFL
jgi:hypothetical protein